MVTDVLQTKLDPNHLIETTSFMRWLKQLFYFRWQERYQFDTAARSAIEQAVKAAEAGHAGEIKVVIEGHLPLNTALFQGATGRARDLFASLGVWDTELNSGVLLYINLCEHRVEIVADRGINAKIAPDRWLTICQQITAKLGDNKHQHGVVLGIELIGQTLLEFYTVLDSEAGNELSDAALFL
ncbi:TPM domain-containing protein [Aquirhabdus sp.]|uniref:TPM domain-containing protein n=1 Tax=Aquirhabdus sp. TaxID=2824160 RepID=UPI00396CF041